MSGCGGWLVARKNKSTGQEFLGCTHYPKCKYTEPIDEGDEETWYYDDVDLYDFYD
jgi:ssDNA-binding Zn-finger/Zn-ribbon topoisomerase 1